MLKPKKSLTSMDYAALALELQEITGSYFRKSYQPERNVIVIRLNTDKGRKDLVIHTGKALYLTEKGPENPPQPTGFAMLLRKHLTNGRITSIEQQDFDRILRIGIQKDEVYDLIIEGFGDGNVILVKAGKIVQPLISRSWRHRIVRAGAEYENPPSRTNPMRMEFKEFKYIIDGSERDVVRTLAMDLNLGGIYAEELCFRCEIEKSRSCGDLLSDEKNALFKEIGKLFEQLDTMDPGLVMMNGSFVDVLPFPLRVYSQYDGEFIRREGFDTAIEEYFSAPQESETEEVNPKIQKIERTIEQQKTSILKLEQDIESNKERAERLYLRYQEFDTILKEIQERGEKDGWNQVAIALNDNPMVREINVAERYIILRDKPTDIRLDYMKTLNENAQRYFEAASKSKDKLTGARKALQVSYKRLEVAKEEDIKVKESAKHERKYFWFERYRWFISSDGNIIVGGKDAKTNDRVVKKYLKERDRYAHAEIHGAPSLVIKAIQGEEIGEKTLIEACIYAACFSRAWKADIGNVEAYWVYPDQVSKTPASGEFLAKGAFIIRGKRNRVSAPLKLAIGKISYENVDLVMCGPVSAIENQTSNYMIIIPGDIPKNNFAKQLSAFFQVSNQEILSILPGDVRITEVHGSSDLDRNL